MPLPLSAGDWIRLKRVVGGSRYESEKNKDITNVALPADATRPFPLTRDVGSSRIRRESSKWTDYVAAKNGGYVLQSENTTSLVPARKLNVINCMCGVTPPLNMSAKFTGCTRCTPAQHLRM